MGENDDVFVARGVSLHGDPASRFILRFGWCLTSVDEDFFFSGDVMRHSGFAVTRYRHSAGVFTFVHHDDDDGLDDVMVWAVVEGTLAVHSGGRVMSLSPGMIGLIRAREIVRAECETSTRCVLVRLAACELEAGAMLATGVASKTYLPMLLSLTNSLFNHAVMPEDVGFRRVNAAMIDLVIAVIVQSNLTYHRPDPEVRDDLYERAVTLLTAQASDQNMTVAVLARRLGVSRSTLARVFHSVGDSPSRHLRTARARLAARLLRDGESEVAAARRAGFGGVRRMRSAFVALGWTSFDDDMRGTGDVVAAGHRALDRDLT